LEEHGGRNVATRCALSTTSCRAVPLVSKIGFWLHIVNNMPTQAFVDRCFVKTSCRKLMIVCVVVEGTVLR